RLFWTSLLAGRVLARETVDRFLSPSVRVTERDATWHYGYGVWLREIDGVRIASLEGSDPGASMESRVRIADGLTMTVLSNTADGAGRIAPLLDEALDAGC